MGEQGSAWGRLTVSNVSNALSKWGWRQSPLWQGQWARRQRGSGQGLCKAGRGGVGLGGSGDESCSTTTFQMSLCAMFVLPFPLNAAEKRSFMTGFILGFASQSLSWLSHSFPPQHTHRCTHTGLHFCASWAKFWAELSPSYRESLRHPHWQIYLEVILNQITCAPSEHTCASYRHNRSLPLSYAWSRAARLQWITTTWWVSLVYQLQTYWNPCKSLQYKIHFDINKY